MKRFDGAPVWAAIPERSRDDLGRLLVEWAYASTVTNECEGEHNTPAERACVAGLDVIEAQLLEELADVLPFGLASEDNDTAVPLSVGQVCADCGCTENDPCFPPCSWAKPDPNTPASEPVDRCTACV